MRRYGRWFLLLGVVVGVGLGWWLWPTALTRARLGRLREFFNNPAAHPTWLLQAGERCGDAPAIMPTTGYLGFGYGDSWSIGQRHQGFDIFGPDGLGHTPVLAAYPGYVTRLPDWKSTLIIRIPHDPLQPNRQIWMYYTHMADPAGQAFISPDFPPGTAEKFVEAGRLLGYQGNYSGEPGNPVGIHLHFSIVQDDGAGHFLNEAKIENTLDPSPYLGLNGNVNDDWIEPVVCEE